MLATCEFLSARLLQYDTLYVLINLFVCLIYLFKIHVIQNQYVTDGGYWSNSSTHISAYNNSMQRYIKHIEHTG